MASLTLLEYSKSMQGTDVERAVVETFARSSMILEILPFRQIQGNAYKYNQEKALPGIAFRGINESYTPAHGIINPITESLKIAGGDLVVDKFLVDTEGVNRRAAEETMQLKALANSFQVSFFKGDTTSNVNDLDGLQSRISGNQIIDNAAATEPLSLAKLDEAIDAVMNPTHLMMNKTMRRRITQAARNTAVGGYVVHERDTFGRMVTFYNDIPIVALESISGQDDVLPFTESGSSSGTDATSIYCANIGTSMLTGIVNGGMSARDMGELETRPALLTRVEWYPGLTIMHPRAVSRTIGITDAAVTV